MNQPPSSKSDGSSSSGPSNNTFLFINESTSQAGRKIGRRSDIKAHVRNHIVSKKRDKKDKTAEDFQNKETAKPPPPNNHAPPSRQPATEWIHTPAHHIPPVPDTPADIISNNTLSPSPRLLRLPEAGWYQCYKPDELTRALSAPLPKPNFVSEVLERVIELVIRDYKEPQATHQKQAVPVVELPSVRQPDSSGSSVESGFDSLQISHTDCTNCGDLKRAWMDCEDHGSVWDRLRKILTRNREVASEMAKRQAHGSRPLDYLGKLGHGRIDPFNTYPTLNRNINAATHELIDHSITYLLPGLWADGSSKSAPSPKSTAWVSSALQSPLIFHAFVFTASIHLSYLHTATIHPNSSISLIHKRAVIYHLSEALKSPTERIKDEVILSLMVLSCHEVVDLKLEEIKCFDSPLKRMQWLNVYGNIRNTQEHFIAIMNLLNLRGGVENLEMFNLPDMLLGGDVIAATTDVQKPSFQPLKRSAQFLDDALVWAVLPPRLPQMTLASAFKSYTSNGLSSDMLTIFDYIAALTLGIEQYLCGDPTALPSTEIASIRVACQHRLLLLPTSLRIFEMSDHPPYLYEAVRLTANIYAIAVIFPVPRVSYALQTLVQQLVLAIEEAEIEKYGGEIPIVLLWMLVLGGIAALGRPEREWYVEHLVRLVKNWEAMKEWKDVEAVLGKFLWLDSACGREGRALWGVVMETKRFEETGLWLTGNH